MGSPTFNIIIRGGLLTETQAYCSVSCAQDRRSIDQFIRGLKAAGLWDLLIEGWLLRSAQNAGTGSTAFGLKGIADGSLTGGPVWMANGSGMNFVPNSYILTTLAAPINQQDRTFFSFFKPLGGDGWMFFSGIQSVGQGFGALYQGTGNILCARWSDDLPTYAYTVGVFQSVAFSRASGTDYGFLNGVQAQSKSSSGKNTAASNVILGNRADGLSYMQGTISVDLVFSGAVDQTALHSIVRNTICSDL